MVAGVERFGGRTVKRIHNAVVAGADGDEVFWGDDQAAGESVKIALVVQKRQVDDDGQRIFFLLNAGAFVGVQRIAKEVVVNVQNG